MIKIIRYRTLRYYIRLFLLNKNPHLLLVKWGKVLILVDAFFKYAIDVSMCRVDKRNAKGRLSQN